MKQGNSAAGVVTQYVAECIHGFARNSLPPPVVQKVKDIVLDSLGCQLGGAQLKNGRLVIEYVRGLGDRPGCSVVGSAWLAQLPLA